MNPIRVISTTSVALVALLALLSFLISYHALADLAVSTGATPPELKWAFPLVLDGAIIVFSCAALRCALMKESTRWPFTLVALATLMSIVLNVLHLEGSALGRFMAATPPLLLAMSIETIIRQIRSQIERNQVLQSSSDLQEQRDKLETELTFLKTRSAQDSELSPKQLELMERRKLIAELDADGKSKQEIADEVGVSAWTVKRDLEIVSFRSAELVGTS